MAKGRETGVDLQEAQKLVTKKSLPYLEKIESTFSTSCRPRRTRRVHIVEGCSSEFPQCSVFPLSEQPALAKDLGLLRKVTLKYAVVRDANSIRLFALNHDGTVTIGNRTAAPEVFNAYLSDVPQREPDPEARPRGGVPTRYAVYAGSDGEVRFELRRNNGTYWLVTYAGPVRVAGRVGGLTFVRFDGAPGDVTFLDKFFGVIATPEKISTAMAVE